uniref:LITAF domain-containing protein n=1 Tax=Stegastes partitus TaxID=144197 RepID=A0A3B5A8M7_9TELE
MEPPSYDEASRHPPAGATQVFTISPPPAYDASLPSPPTPPPTYGEAGEIKSCFHSSDTADRTSTRTKPPVPVSVNYLRDSPCLVRCTNCRRLVTTKVQFVPGQTAWCLSATKLNLCALCFRLVCGFCLIPLMVPRCQDVHHSCPRCILHKLL